MDKKIGVLGGMGPMASQLFYKLFIKNNLEDIFGEHIVFTNCYLNDLADGQKLHADAFLAIDEYIYQQASKSFISLNMVSKLTWR